MLDDDCLPDFSFFACTKYGYKEFCRTCPYMTSRRVKLKGRSSIAAESVRMQDAELVAVLQECAKKKQLDRGKAIHADVLVKGLLHRDVYLGSALINLYVKCGELNSAHTLFDGLPIRNVASWTALIGGYSQYGFDHKALICYDQMRCEGISPNELTFCCALKACSHIRSLEKGIELHAEIIQKGALENDILLGTALLNMYAKCGELAKARELFEKLENKDVVSWTTMITAYVQHGYWEDALSSFKEMKVRGIAPNGVTIICMLKVCGSTYDLDTGKEIHGQIIQEALLEECMLVGNALVDMYAKCGAIAETWQVFQALTARDLVSWTALISGYAQDGYGEEALKCFQSISREGFLPNVITWVCILNACGSMAVIDKGKQVHAVVFSEVLFEKDISIGNALVDMYVKCGLHEMAQKVFEKLPLRDVVSWITLISAYSQLGRVDLVIDLLNKMVCDGIEHNPVTFTVLLNACRNSGVMDIGQLYCERMCKTYGTIPNLEQHACMVDLLARAGHFEEAVTIIKEMPTTDYLPLWTALLGACQRWGNVELGMLAFDHALQLDENYASSYVCMFNIYSTELRSTQ